MGDEDDEDEPDIYEEFETAQEHGHALGDWMADQDGYHHPALPDRNSDGTFR